MVEIQPPGHPAGTLRRRDLVGRDRTRPRRLLLPAFLLAAGLVAGAAVMAEPGPTTGPVAAPSSPDPQVVEDQSWAAQTPATEPTPATTPEPGEVLSRSDWSGSASGVFRHTSEDAVEEYEDWLGAPVEIVSDYGARDDWDQISSPSYLFDEWAGTGRRLTLGVAMLPEADASATIELGAQGAYDRHFAELARGLVAAGHEDAVLRVGWEANLAAVRWSSSDPVAWVTYWRRIVAAMKAVPGQEFRFDWTVNNGQYNDYDAVDYYPGDDVVDYVGVDVYDTSWAAGTYPIPAGCTGACAERRQEFAWDYVVRGTRRGLDFWSGFAAEHDKQMSLPEWGLWDRPDGADGDDNAVFIQRMVDFIDDPANAVGYDVYFEYTGDQGAHALMTGFPEASALFRQLRGDGPPPPVEGLPVDGGEDAQPVG